MKLTLQSLAKKESKTEDRGKTGILSNVKTYKFRSGILKFSVAK